MRKYIKGFSYRLSNMCPAIDFTTSDLLTLTMRFVLKANSDVLRWANKIEKKIIIQTRLFRQSIDQMISMQSKDGSVVELLTSINSDMDDYWLAKRNKLSLDIYYPGQEVVCTLLVQCSHYFRIHFF